MSRLMKKFASVAIASTVAACVSSTASAAVIYRETFPNGGANNKSISVEGWEARLRFENGLGAQPSSGFSTFNSNSANNGALGGNATPVNSNPTDSSLTNGGVVNFNNGSFWLQPTLYYTNEYSLDRSINTLDSFGWGQNNQAGDGTGYAAAVQIGTNWFVHDTVFVGFLNATALANGSNWKSLNFATLTVSGVSSALPAGNPTGFGLFTTRAVADGSSFETFDNFVVNATAIPEPASIAAVGLSMLILLRRQR